MNFPCSNHQEHRVFRFDGIDIAPANFELMNRVRDNNSFVANYDLRFDEQKVSANSDYARPENGWNRATESTNDDAGYDHSGAENVDQSGIHEVTARPEDFRVTHEGSFSRKLEGSLR